MRGAAAPEGQMTYDSTQGDYWEVNLGSERPDFWSGRSEVTSGDSERLELRSDWLDFESGRLLLRS